MPPERAAEAALHEVLEALASGGSAEESPCAICRLRSRSVEREMRAFFAEFVNDPRTRETFRQTRGFCAEHTPLLASLGDALAVAILYSDLARLTRERWLAENSRRGLRLGRPRAERPPAPCPACVAAQEAEQRYAAALASRLDEAAVWDALEKGSGLCVAHIEQVAATAKPASATRLREREAARLAALQAELEEIIRKNDYRFRGEAWGAEKDAWMRALLKITRPRT